MINAKIAVAVKWEVRYFTWNGAVVNFFVHDDFDLHKYCNVDIMKTVRASGNA